LSQLATDCDLDPRPKIAIPIRLPLHVARREHRFSARQSSFKKQNARGRQMVQERTFLDSPQPELQPEKLSPWETFGQSLASVAPTATPAMVIPLVLAACGKTSWLAYLLATIGVACITYQINLFARKTSSPGSLYSFVRGTLGKWPSLVTGWALLIAYAGTAAAVTGGVTSYMYALFVPNAQPPLLIAAVITALAIGISAYLAYRDVQISARLMLWIEASSVLLILALLLWPGHPGALRWDRSQLLLQDVSIAGLRNGLVLAIFSFVGFESAATLGAEASDPHKTIPRAIRLTAFGSGLFFIFAAYAESIGFGDRASTLQNAGAPLQLLAQLRGLPFLSPALSVGAGVSFFACALACITAGARTLFSMSRDGYVPAIFGRAHASNHTPHSAVILTSAVAFATSLTFVSLRVLPFDIYGWVGTVATYGFITVYLAVTAAGLIRSVRERLLTPLNAIFSAGALVVLGLAAWSSVDLSAPPPYRWLPHAYVALLAVGVLFSWLTANGRKPNALAETKGSRCCIED
jgi:amino acid transporter